MPSIKRNDFEKCQKKACEITKVDKSSYANILILWNWNAQFLKRLLAFTRDTAVQRKRPRLESLQDWGKTLLEKNVTKCNRKAGQSGRQFLRNYKLVRIVCDLIFCLVTSRIMKWIVSGVFSFKIIFYFAICFRCGRWIVVCVNCYSLNNFYVVSFDFFCDLKFNKGWPNVVMQMYWYCETEMHSF